MSSANQKISFTLTPTQRAALSEGARIKRFPRGAVIVSEADATDAVYIILEGRVRIFVANENGKEVTLNRQGPGEYFGELSLDGGSRSASVITLEASRFMIIPREQLAKIFATHPDFALNLVHKLIDRVRALTDRVKSLALQDVYARVRHALEELATSQDGVYVIVGRLTHADLASRIGASREMVSRIFSDLKAGGYLSQTRGSIVLHRKLPAEW